MLQNPQGMWGRGPIQLHEYEIMIMIAVIMLMIMLMINKNNGLDSYSDVNDQFKLKSWKFPKERVAAVQSNPDEPSIWGASVTSAAKMASQPPSLHTIEENDT